MPAPTSASAPFTRSSDQITPVQDRPARAAATAARGLPANHSAPPAASNIRATSRPPATAQAGSMPIGSHGERQHDRASADDDEDRGELARHVAQHGLIFASRSSGSASWTAPVPYPARVVARSDG